MKVKLLGSYAALANFEQSHEGPKYSEWRCTAVRQFIWKLALSGCLFICPKLTCSQEAKRPLTVADSVESTKVLSHFGTGPVLISPDGRRYVVALQRGDIARNGSWVELLSGGTTSLDAACKIEIVARLFSKSTALVTDLIKNGRWWDDNEHVSFLWDDGLGTPQVVELNVTTHELHKLTHSLTVINGYDISSDGKTLIYIARGRRPNPSVVARMRSKGFAITEQDIGSLLRGDIDGWTPWRHFDTFISSTKTGQIHAVREPGHKWFMSPNLLSISPDGRYAVTERPADDLPADWDKYTEHVFRDIYLPPARQHPGEPNAIRQYYLIDIQHAVATPMWDAPENVYGAVVWAPDSRSFILGPTFLPTKQTDAVGLAGWVVVEVSVTTGKHVRVPVPVGLPPHAYRPLSWEPNGVIEFTGTEDGPSQGRRLRFKKASGSWEPVTESTNDNAQFAGHVRIEVRQDPNTPPALYAVENTTGREKLIKDLNPQLRKELTLGRVELVHWKAADGRPWTGLLYYPVHYEQGHRFPLVIQTHGYSAKDFNLDGGFATMFAAQPLANRDIAVLQINAPDDDMADVDGTPREPEAAMAGYEGAIQEFTKDGLVDPDKVGVVGFSRTGWHVEYALTHSKFRFAAAEVADNMDGSYVQNALSEYTSPSELEADNGSIPIGIGLETWLRVAPGFNTDKIHTPLRMEIDSAPFTSSVLDMWEIFNNLRYLRKPVELFVIPDIEHGVHILQNPAQRLASQGATVDWFRFWLKGEEDPNPAKAEQYARWRELRKLQEENDAKGEAPAN